MSHAKHNNNRYIFPLFDFEKEDLIQNMKSRNTILFRFTDYSEYTHMVKVSLDGFIEEYEKFRRGCENNP